MWERGGVADLNSTTQAQLINIHAATIKLFFPIIHPLSYEHNGQSTEIKPQWATERNEKLKRCAGKKKTKSGLIPRGEGEKNKKKQELIRGGLDQEY